MGGLVDAEIKNMTSVVFLHNNHVRLPLNLGILV